MKRPTGIITTIVRIGINMLKARRGTSFSSRTLNMASSTVSSPWGLKTTPCAARSSAPRIGPRLSFVHAVIPASVTAAIAYMLIGIERTNTPSGSET